MLLCLINSVAHAGLVALPGLAVFCFKGRQIVVKNKKGRIY